MKTKRALIRAVEKQAEMEERMDLLKARLKPSVYPDVKPRVFSNPNIAASRSTALLIAHGHHACAHGCRLQRS